MYISNLYYYIYYLEREHNISQKPLQYTIYHLVENMRPKRQMWYRWSEPSCFLASKIPPKHSIGSKHILIC